MLQQNISWFDRPENSAGTLCARLSTEASAVHEVNNSSIDLFRLKTNLF
jgi:hypothetical protein